MKKILIALFATFFLYSNANSADFKMPEFNLPDIDFNGTIGVGATSNLGHAKGSETGNSTTNTHVVKEGGVFVDDSMTIFAEDPDNSFGWLFASIPVYQNWTAWHLHTLPHRNH